MEVRRIQVSQYTGDQSKSSVTGYALNVTSEIASTQTMHTNEGLGLFVDRPKVYYSHKDWNFLSSTFSVFSIPYFIYVIFFNKTWVDLKIFNFKFSII